MNPRMRLDMLAAGKHRNPLGVAAGNAMGAYDSKARDVQEALMQLTGRIPLGEIAGKGSGIPGQSQIVGAVDRFAGSDAALMGIKAVPAVAALAGLGLKDEDETFANQAMDLLGMGAGMYGMNRGINALGGTTRAGAALGAGVGAFGGTMGVDALQGLVGI